MEKRDLNISFYKAGNQGISTRMTLPKKWVQNLGVTPENRAVEVSYNEEMKAIVIKKK